MKLWVLPASCQSPRKMRGFGPQAPPLLPHPENDRYAKQPCLPENQKPLCVPDSKVFVCEQHRNFWQGWCNLSVVPRNVRFLGVVVFEIHIRKQQNMNIFSQEHPILRNEAHSLPDFRTLSVLSPFSFFQEDLWFGASHHLAIYSPPPPA